MDGREPHERRYLWMGWMVAMAVSVLPKEDSCAEQLVR